MKWLKTNFCHYVTCHVYSRLPRWEIHSPQGFQVKADPNRGMNSATEFIMFKIHVQQDCIKPVVNEESPTPHSIASRNTEGPRRPSRSSSLFSTASFVNDTPRKPSLLQKHNWDWLKLLSFRVTRTLFPANHARGSLLSCLTPHMYYSAGLQRGPGAMRCDAIRCNTAVHSGKSTSRQSPVTSQLLQSCADLGA